MSAERKTETIPEWKREEVDAIAELLSSYESVGVVDIAGIPSRQLQDMRRELHGSAELRVSRNTLLKRALEAVDEGVEVLTDVVSGQVGLIGTNDNPFGLYQQLEASKTSAPIGAGEVAPNDIVLEEQDTGIDPGPFVGDLQQVGASARIQQGSIHITEDSLVCEAGESVSADLANVLGELGLEPKEVGLDLRAVVSEGVRFEPDELELDVEAYREDISTAAARGQNLSVNAAYPTDRTTPTLVSTASGDATSLGLAAAVASPDTAPDLIGKADAQVKALAAQIDDEEALPEDLHDVEAPAEAPAADEDADDADTSDEEPATEDTDEDEDKDDEDGGDAAAGLGNMFG